MTGITSGQGLRLTIDGPVATLTFDREPTGLLTATTVGALAGHADALAGDDTIRVVVLRSDVPDFFACHYDATEILAFDKRDERDDQLKPFHSMCEALQTMPKVTIAVLEGRAGGGGAEIALSCDMRFADRDRAVLCQPEVAMGIIPGGSGTVRLPRLAGRARALEVVLGCDDIDAATAERWGLVNRSLPSDELWPFVDRLVARIASFPQHAVVRAKAAVLGDDDVTAHLLHEARLFREVLAHPAAAAQLRRFLDAGGQSPDVEARLGEFLGELAVAENHSKETT